MIQIPKIIHQIWEGRREPLPEFLAQLGQTWQVKNPDWQYQFWDDDRMTTFVKEYYPQYWSMYEGFPYDVQRWDAIRYMILYKHGGLYVDFDYECLEPFNGLLDGQTCCIGLEPRMHAGLFNREQLLGNALMASIAGTPFMGRIIEYLFSLKRDDVYNKFSYVLNTTGPFMLTDVYDQYADKDTIYLIPEELISPFSKGEVILYRNGMANEDLLEKKLENAIAIHYFLGTWC